MYDYKDMAERAHFEATHKKIDGGPGSGRKKGTGSSNKALSSWEERKKLLGGIKQNYLREIERKK